MTSICVVLVLNHCEIIIWRGFILPFRELMIVYLYSDSDLFFFIKKGKGMDLGHVICELYFNLDGTQGGICLKASRIFILVMPVVILEL